MIPREKIFLSFYNFTNLCCLLGNFSNVVFWKHPISCLDFQFFHLFCSSSLWYFQALHICCKRWQLLNGSLLLLEANETLLPYSWTKLFRNFIYFFSLSPKFISPVFFGKIRNLFIPKIEWKKYYKYIYIYSSFYGIFFSFPLSFTFSRLLFILSFPLSSSFQFFFTSSFSPFSHFVLISVFCLLFLS